MHRAVNIETERILLDDLFRVEEVYPRHIKECLRTGRVLDDKTLVKLTWLQPRVRRGELFTERDNA